jgi:hypothetical protein
MYVYAAEKVKLFTEQGNRKGRSVPRRRVLLGREGLRQLVSTSLPRPDGRDGRPREAPAPVLGAVRGLHDAANP